MPWGGWGFTHRLGGRVKVLNLPIKVARVDLGQGLGLGLDLDLRVAVVAAEVVGVGAMEAARVVVVVAVVGVAVVGVGVGVMSLKVVIRVGVVQSRVGEVRLVRLVESLKTCAALFFKC